MGYLGNLEVWFGSHAHLFPVQIENPQTNPNPHHVVPAVVLEQVVALQRAHDVVRHDRRHAGLTLPNVRLVTWTTLAVSNRCYDCKIT